MKILSPWRLGAAAAIAFCALYAGCALAVVLFPAATVEFFNSWFHGVDLRLIVPSGGRPLTAAGFVSGLASVAAVSFAAGAGIAAVYNALGGSGRVGRSRPPSRG